jgi:glutamate racemase
MTELHVEDRPIGIFDSGIGGLTVASAIHQRLPGEDIIYLGDTARVPYGTKSHRAINQYSLESTLFLFNRGVKLIVAACNTVSAVALPQLQELLRAPILGVLDPGAQAAISTTRTGRVGVIGTPSTIRSGAYQSRLRQIRPSLQIWGKACPLLVPLAEEGKLDGEIVDGILEEYLKPMKKHDIDTLILGCTHYPLFKPAIGKAMGDGVKLVDSAETTAAAVEETLLRKGLLRTHGSGSLTCYITDIPTKFNILSKRFFGVDIKRPQRVTLGN